MKDFPPIFVRARTGPVHMNERSYHKFASEYGLISGYMEDNFAFEIWAFCTTLNWIRKWCAQREVELTSLRMEIQVSSDIKRPKSSSYAVLSSSVGAHLRSNSMPYKAEIMFFLSGFKERTVSTMVKPVNVVELDNWERTKCLAWRYLEKFDLGRLNF